MSQPTDPKVRARVRELLADVGRSVDLLGIGARPADDALRALDRISACSQRLSRTNAALMPLIQRFRDPGTGKSWFARFIGQSLEREVRFDAVCAEIEGSIRDGSEDRDELYGMVDALRREQQSMAAEIAALEIDMAAGRLLLAPAAAKLRAGLPVDEEHWQRMERRVSNLEAMATALALTRQQYDVAAQHARVIGDRFAEIKDLLLPIWYQRMGFELFAQRAGPGTAVPTPSDPTRSHPEPELRAVNNEHARA